MKDKKPPTLTLVGTPEDQKRKRAQRRAPATFVEAKMHEIDGRTVVLVDARELHSFLGSATRYNDWLNDRISDLRLREGHETFSVDGGILLKSEYKSRTPSNDGKNLPTPPAKRGRPRSRDCMVTLQIAKTISMMDKGPKGEETRDRYFRLEERFDEEVKKGIAQAVEERLSRQNELALVKRDQHHALEMSVTAERLNQEKLVALTTRDERHVLEMGAAVERVRQEVGTTEAEIERRVQAVARNEIQHREMAERRSFGNGVRRRTNHRPTTLTRYYTYRGVKPESLPELLMRAFSLILAEGTATLTPVDEDGITNEPLFALLDIEWWRSHTGYIMEREMGLVVPNPRYDPPP